MTSMDQLDAAGRSESLSSRLRIMIALAPGISDDYPGAIAERLRGLGFEVKSEVVQSHLDGASIPSARERRAYADACQWHDDTSMLSDDPEAYLLPLVQAEILLSIRNMGMPHARGGNGLPVFALMSVVELRDYRAYLFSSGRLSLLAS
ncbi:hypothetical protein [Williamsia sp.]|uniref:hypothetical protein n=1 Tax=Williamsia sp. TaxID=1872085 RepID=UPI001A202679|nr:hypothetical protein [Williamsia sp.]MBJ7287551.1 hypothetical protein [Williamsia sp.]